MRFVQINFKWDYLFVATPSIKYFQSIPCLIREEFPLASNKICIKINTLIEKFLQSLPT